MDSLAETVTVGDHELVLGGWYAHPDFGYNCIGQLGYTLSGDLKFLIYRLADAGEANARWESWCWADLEDYDLGLVRKIGR